MTTFDAHIGTTQMIDPPSSVSSRSSSVATENALSHYFEMNSLSQSSWPHNLAIPGAGFVVDENGFLDGAAVNGANNIFETLPYDDCMYSPDFEGVDMNKAARQARRKAQNRAAQRKFRERKDCQLKALGAEIEDLRVQIQGSRTTIADLQRALTEARTQVDILKSILPSIAKSSENASTRSLGSLQSHEGGGATLGALLSSLLHGKVKDDARRGSIPTPESAQGDDGLQYS